MACGEVSKRLSSFIVRQTMAADKAIYMTLRDIAACVETNRKKKKKKLHSNTKRREQQLDPVNQIIATAQRILPSTRYLRFPRV